MFPVQQLFVLISSINAVLSNTVSVNITSQLHGSTISCPSDNACHLSCITEESCADSIIICPENKECTITCSGTNSCHNAVIVAESSSFLLLSDCSQSGSCIGMTMYCPEDDRESSKCIVASYVIYLTVSHIN